MVEAIVTFALGVHLFTQVHRGSNLCYLDSAGATLPFLRGRDWKEHLNGRFYFHRRVRKREAVFEWNENDQYAHIAQQSIDSRAIMP